MTENISHTHKVSLAKAQNFLENNKNNSAADPWQLVYHISPLFGWMNDPNGLIYYQGEYHVFYQYHPFSPEWGPMHWGHTRSVDLVHWENLPMALAPSELYDEGGCWSGSAVNDNGTLSLIYSGNTSHGQVQCLATGTDGVHFEKLLTNPVLSVPPADGSGDFRDPKVWWYQDSWYMMVGSGKDGRGKALLYQSRELQEWTYRGVLAESDGTQGWM